MNIKSYTQQERDQDWSMVHQNCIYYNITNNKDWKNKEQRLEELTMRPIISNIATTTYEVAKYLNKLSKSLTKLESNILNTKALVRKLRKEMIPTWNEMIYFDVKILFINTPLDKPIDFLLEKCTIKRKSKHAFPKQS